MESWAIALIVLITLGGLAVASYFIYEAVKNDKTTVTPTPTSQVKFERSSISSNRTIHDETASCEPVTDDEILLNNRITEGMQSCDRAHALDPDDWHLAYIHHGKKPKFFYRERHANDMSVPLTNVTGAIYNIHVVTGRDIYSHGFDVGEDSDDFDSILRELERNTIDNGTLLVGNKLIPIECSPPYTFDVADGSNLPLSSDSLDSVGVISSEALGGALRMAARHMDYHYTLDGKEFHVRVSMGGCEGRMGDKMMLVDGGYKWLDLENQEFTSVRPEKALSMWNNPEEGKQGPREDTSGRPEAFTDLYRAKRMAMPIQLTNESVDFSELTSGFSLQLHLDGGATFKGHAETSEADLANDLKEQIRRFEIDDLTIRGND